jgi:hypothetical protein
MPKNPKKMDDARQSNAAHMDAEIGSTIDNEDTLRKRSRTGSQPNRAFSHFSLDSFRFLSGDFEFIQTYGSKIIETFNSRVNALLTVRFSRRTVSYAFWFLYCCNVFRYSVYPAVGLSIWPNKYDETYFMSQIGLSLFFTCFLLFEFLSTLKLNDMLKVSQYSLNFYILFVISVLCAIDCIIRFSVRYDTFLLAYMIARAGLLFPIFFCLLSMSYEMSQALHSIMNDCCYDPRLNMDTYQMILTKEEAMENTMKFYESLSTLHSLLEFKLLANLLFSTWAIINSVYFSTPQNFLVSFCLVTVLLFSSMSQPFYLQRVIKRIERQNNISLNFSIEVLNIEASYLWVVLPLVTLVLAVVKDLMGMHYCSVP